MQDFLNTVILICAALGSLSFGVVLAFCVCRAGFVLLRVQTRPIEDNGVQAKAQTIEV
jgi:hypothetical protein